MGNFWVEFFVVSCDKTKIVTKKKKKITLLVNIDEYLEEKIINEKQRLTFTSYYEKKKKGREKLSVTYADTMVLFII